LGVYDDNNGLDKMTCKSDLELWGRDFTPTNEKLDTPKNNKKYKSRRTFKATIAKNNKPL